MPGPQGLRPAPARWCAAPCELQHARATAQSTQRCQASRGGTGVVPSRALRTGRQGTGRSALTPAAARHSGGCALPGSGLRLLERARGSRHRPQPTAPPQPSSRTGYAASHLAAALADRCPQGCDPRAHPLAPAWVVTRRGRRPVARCASSSHGGLHAAREGWRDRLQVHAAGLSAAGHEQPSKLYRSPSRMAYWVISALLRQRIFERMRER